MNKRYMEQVSLLLRILPKIAKLNTFALKGGTAINVFERDLPRLSVDIDLCFPKISARHEALREIKSALTQIKKSVERAIPGIVVDTANERANEFKLLCRTPQAQVKVEVNTTMRGNAFPLRIMPIKSAVQEFFELFFEMQLVSREELFGGKICAALDRQHPRDLFDIYLLFQEEGLSRSIILGFLVSIISHNRPIHELISPNLSDQSDIFEAQFAGMTQISFTYDDYQATRERLVREIKNSLSADDKAFLMSMKQGQPI